MLRRRDWWVRKAVIVFVSHAAAAAAAAVAADCIVSVSDCLLDDQDALTRIMVLHEAKRIIHEQRFFLHRRRAPRLNIPRALDCLKLSQDGTSPSSRRPNGTPSFDAYVTKWLPGLLLSLNAQRAEAAVVGHGSTFCFPARRQDHVRFIFQAGCQDVMHSGVRAGRHFRSGTWRSDPVLPPMTTGVVEDIFELTHLVLSL